MRDRGANPNYSPQRSTHWSMSTAHSRIKVCSTDPGTVSRPNKRALAIDAAKSVWGGASVCVIARYSSTAPIMRFSLVEEAAIAIDTGV